MPEDEDAARIGCFRPGKFDLWIGSLERAPVAADLANEESARCEVVPGFAEHPVYQVQTILPGGERHGGFVPVFLRQLAHRTRSYVGRIADD